jgi:DMSO/TMAO reductase YedYZ molybdopterin-dependent catalytic subunit
MSTEEDRDIPQPEKTPSTGEPPGPSAPERKAEEIQKGDLADQKNHAAAASEPPESLAAEEQQPGEDTSQPPTAGEPQIPEAASSTAPQTARTETPKQLFPEQPPAVIEVASRVLRSRTRRDFLLFGAGAVSALAGVGLLLPQDTLARLGLRGNTDSPGKEWFLNRALRIDDDVAEALYSRNRLVPTYTKNQITSLKNNYNGATPDPDYISGWQLTLEGLASGLSVSLDIRNLLTRFQPHEQITRLVCVEGWSAVAWWSGLRFDDLLLAYPPMSQAKWARVESSVNLDAQGNPDPYYVSLDLATARHPQTLLATHFNGQPLTVDHGAPVRLLVPVKLGLKNVKAVTKITYVAEQPQDYWAERGYSRYDGI